MKKTSVLNQGKTVGYFSYEVPSKNYLKAKERCHVRSAIRRKSKPEIKYWKNHTESLDSRIPDEDKFANDWEEYDPREHEECSAFNEMPA